MKKRRNSKTMWFAAFVAGSGALQGLVPALSDVVPATVYPWLLVGVGVAVAALREMTTDSVRKQPQDNG
jgi:hypothetical protein